ncbi:MAG: large repetitive protein [Verrucomicrobiota bacterium]|jgi:hypothetical protein
MKRKSSPESGVFNPRVFAAFLLCSGGVLLGVFSIGAPTGPNAPAKRMTSQFKPVTISARAHGVSPKVRDLPVRRGSRQGPFYEAEPVRPIHAPHKPPQLPVYDPVQQTVARNAAVVVTAAPSLLQTFEGMNQADGCGGCIPPDPNGAVGPNHYVEMVNSSYAVYDKTGTKLAGPIHINDLFAPLTGSRCAADNDGDPIVVYDHLADRWVLTEFAVNAGNGPYAQCIAVSTTSDPTGSFYVYDFDQPAFNDYPKFGVWPDAYYMTSNEFGGTGGTFSGAGVFAFERDQMLVGQMARMVFFDEGLVNSSFGGMLPSYLDGPPPPAGSPNYFAEVDSQINTPSLGGDAMRIWKFHVDWTNTANSTFGMAGQPDFTLPVAMWTPAQCVESQGTCVQQLGSPYQLDVIGDRLMFRLVYRNFGDHESLLVNHSVVADARIGVRWYEVRSPGSSPMIYQQSTFAPVDSLSRWMGSAAMDRAGNIVVGYSTSSAASFPSIAYAGRLATDPLNDLTQGEAQMFAGLGSENVAFYLPPVGRWGDYTALTLDPSDGCTFWYVNEYFGSMAETDPGAPWQTRIGSFKFPSCTASAPTPLSVVSRKVHGNGASTHTADLDLLPPSSNIEMRRNTAFAVVPSPNAGKDHEIVITFPGAVRVGNVTVTSNNAADTPAPSATFDVNGAVVTIDLHNIKNSRRLTIHLGSVSDFNSAADIDIPMGVLLGDTNRDGNVDGTDVSQTKSQSGNSAANGSAFQEDVNLDGFVDGTDVSLVKNQSGGHLP